MGVVKSKNGVGVLSVGQLSGKSVSSGDAQSSPNIYSWWEGEADTNLVGFRSSNSDQLAMVIYQSAGQSVQIAWGDGSIDNYLTTTVQVAHTYTSAGVYSIRVLPSGNTAEFRYNKFAVGFADSFKWTDILSWGPQLDIIGFQEYFRLSGIGTLISASDSPTAQDWSATFEDTSFNDAVVVGWNLSPTQCDLMFNLTPFNQDISGWDMSQCTSVQSMFSNTPFNQDVSSWIFSVPTSVLSVFQSNTAYNQPVWDATVTAVNGAFYGASSFNQDLSGWTPSGITSMYRFARNASSFNNGGVTGSGQGLDNWDVSNVTNFSEMFYNATPFSCDLGSWTLKTSGDLNMSSGFRSCSNFTGQGLGNWNTERVTNWQQCFQSSGANFPVTHPNYWEMPPGVNVFRMFQSCPFNGGMASGVSGGRNFEVKFSTDPADEYNFADLFAYASSFNQDISTDSVNGYWDVSRVKSFQSWFRFATNFNQDLGNWDVSHAENFGSMFAGTSMNNGGVGGIGVGLDTWDVSSATSMGGMFSSTPFNQNINSWTFPNCTSMSLMFQQARDFDQPLDNWTMTNVNDISDMFNNARSFNQNIGGWDVSGVTDMHGLFEGALSFNQDLSSWDTSSVTDMSNMWAFNGVTYSYLFGSWSIASLQNASLFTTANVSFITTTIYDDMLDITTGWASQATIQSAVSLGVGNAKYTSGGNAEAGRNLLTGTYGWNITDGGPV
jgi:surface protein